MKGYVKIALDLWQNQGKPKKKDTCDVMTTKSIMLKQYIQIVHFAIIIKNTIILPSMS